jgi:hypothetical protein
MPSIIKTNRAAEGQLLAKLISGTTQHITAKVTLGGTVYTPAQVNAVFAAAQSATSDLDTARTSFHTAVQEQEAAMTTARNLWAKLKTYVQATYGKSSPVLQDFGWTVAKQAIKSAQVKAVAAVKAVATRALRHPKVTESASSPAAPTLTPVGGGTPTVQR